MFSTNTHRYKLFHEDNLSLKIIALIPQWPY